MALQLILFLNPLGVPHRMNIGQIMETHLGWGRKCARVSKLQLRSLIGASEEDIEEISATCKLAGKPEKSSLYDGRTGDPPLTIISLLAIPIC